MLFTFYIYILRLLKLFATRALQSHLKAKSTRRTTIGQDKGKMYATLGGCGQNRRTETGEGNVMIKQVTHSVEVRQRTQPGTILGKTCAA